MASWVPRACPQGGQGLQPRNNRRAAAGPALARNVFAVGYQHDELRRRATLKPPCQACSHARSAWTWSILCSRTNISTIGRTSRRGGRRQGAETGHLVKLVSGHEQTSRRPGRTRREHQDRHDLPWGHHAAAPVRSNFDVGGCRNRLRCVRLRQFYAYSGTQRLEGEPT